MIWGSSDLTRKRRILNKMRLKTEESEKKKMQIHENEQGNRKEENKVKYCNGFLKKGGERHEKGSKILV